MNIVLFKQDNTISILKNNSITLEKFHEITNSEDFLQVEFVNDRNIERFLSNYNNSKKSKEHLEKYINQWFYLVEGFMSGFCNYNFK